MKCPFCGSTDTSVKDSRATEDSTAIRRRRVCSECHGRFSTAEHVSLLLLKVKKKTGEIEPFKREKILESLEVALHKRPISAEKIEKVLNTIVRRLEVTGEVEIPSSMIGEIVMEILKELDPVAYVRFASVYRDFREVSDFNQVVKEISKTN